MPNLPTFIGRYRVVERISSGGMGVLYLARDTAIDRPVAIKVARVQSVELRQRFLREARATGRLTHRNIVTIFDVGEHEGEPFMAMEYVPGRTVADIVRRHTPLPLLHRLRLVRELCDGLAYAHGQGIIHRDVKPANLIAREDTGALTILDFGIARLTDGTATHAAVIGTPHYMAPEQIRGAAVDHRCDIFAVGLVFYELLSYRRAFGGESPTAVTYQIVHEEPAPLARLAPELDADLIAIIDRALAKRADDRYQHLSELIADLDTAAARIETDDSDPGATVVVGPADKPPATAPPGHRTRASRAELIARREQQLSRHLDAAGAALKEQRCDAAEAAAEQAALLDPNDERVLEMLEHIATARVAQQVDEHLSNARGHLQELALTSASESVDQALELQPESPAARELRREIEARRTINRRLEEAERHLAAEEFPKAAQRIQEVLKIEPEHPVALKLRDRIRDAERDHRARTLVGAAERQLAAEKFTEAARQVREALKTQPEHAAALALRDRIRDAERDHRARTLVKEAERQLAAEEFTEAAQRVREVLKIEPEHAAALALRERIRDAERDHRARTAVEEARRKRAAGELSAALALLEGFDGAHDLVAAELSTVKAAIRKQRESFETLMAEARSHVEHGNVKDAHDPVRKALEALGAVTDSGSRPEPEPKSARKPAPAAKSEPEPKSAPKPAPAAKSKPTPAAKSALKPAPAPKPEPEPEPKSAPKPAPAAKSKPTPAAKSKPTPAAKSKPTPAPEPKPKPAARQARPDSPPSPARTTRPAAREDAADHQAPGDGGERKRRKLVAALGGAAALAAAVALGVWLIPSGSDRPEPGFAAEPAGLPDLAAASGEPPTGAAPAAAPASGPASASDPGATADSEPPADDPEPPAVRDTPTRTPDPAPAAAVNTAAVAPRSDPAPPPSPPPAASTAPAVDELLTNARTVEEAGNIEAALAIYATVLNLEADNAAATAGRERVQAQIVEQTVRERLRDGGAAFAEGRFDDARGLFQEAFDLNAAPEAAAGLGYLESVDALACGDDAACGTLVLRVEPAAAIIVNDRALGTAAALRLPLSAGRHRLRLETDDWRFPRTIEIAAGATAELDVVLERDGFPR